MDRYWIANGILMEFTLLVLYLLEYDAIYPPVV